MGDHFKSKAVIVTGAGAGLGRQYAIDLALQSADVLLVGRSASVEYVCEEIELLGGNAKALIADAKEGQKIAGYCISTFGRIDGIIINAGQVIDRTFKNMTLDDWQQVLDVHLGGAYALTHASWNHMIARQSGHIILTTSGAGLHGNFGQANYAAAKAGIIGLTKTLAQEGKKHNVIVNAIAPMATTNMTSEIFSAEQLEILTAESVSPIVLAMLHPSYRRSGQIIEAGGGWARALRWQRSAGLNFRNRPLEEVISNLGQVSDFSEASDYPISTTDALSGAMLKAEGKV